MINKYLGTTGNKNLIQEHYKKNERFRKSNQTDHLGFRYIGATDSERLKKGNKEERE